VVVKGYPQVGLGTSECVWTPQSYLQGILSELQLNEGSQENELSSVCLRISLHISKAVNARPKKSPM